MAKKKKKEATASGPDEVTVDKGPDETPEVKTKQPKAKKVKVWRCPHCDTFYRNDMKIAQRNHLARHGVAKG